MKKNNNDILKTGGAILLIIGGLYATVQPLSQQIGFLDRRLTSMEEANNKLINVDVMSKEVQSKFENVERRIVDLEEWKTYSERHVPARNSVQDEILKRLEKDIDCINVKLKGDAP